MSNIFIVIIASIVTVPLLGFYLIYIITMKSTKNKVFSIKLAADLTVILFMTSIYFIVLEIWGFSIIWLFILFFLITAVFFTFLHWKTNDDISIHKVLKGVWRFQFFVFFLVYFFLVIYGFISNIAAI
ncbi:DUF3397 domain-containing protein [Evansella halocellulosilytica]|uniref:DUF3397 domain-containing protein n=1 Tax=Evansella halocellulosilytica TaxID=2011013 RepID=UPI00211CA3D9|nr:DUF3397 domain-containing protein [Evansella halocellulosilytica]